MASQAEAKAIRERFAKNMLEWLDSLPENTPVNLLRDGVKAYLTNPRHL